MNQSRLDPGEHKCFQTTEFSNWRPGKIVSLRIPAPRRGEWILMMCIYGVLFGLVGGYLMYVCLQYFFEPGTMSYLEAFAVCAIPMSIVGALHLAGGDELIGGIEIDWAKGLLVSSSLTGTRRFRLGDLKALVLRGEYYFRLGSTGTSNERVYHARLDAQFQRGEVLLLATDGREQHVEIAVEQLSPFAEKLANALEVELRNEDEVEQRHKGFIRALLNAPTWLHALFAFSVISSAGWTTWRVSTLR